MVDTPRPSFGGKRRVGGEGDVEVFCADEQTFVAVDLVRWQALAEHVLRDEGVRGLAELSVLYVSEAEIAELNHDHMGKDGPTDVLAFPIDAPDTALNAEMVAHNQPDNRGPDRPLHDPGDMPLLLGDVVICPEVAARQAPEHAGNFDDEMALLLVHGVLHVLGHDHHEPEATTAMRARELELLQQHHWNGPAPDGFRQDHPE